MAGPTSIAPGENFLLEVISATGAGQTFTFPMKGDGGDFNVLFQADAGTTISADLQVSVAGGPFVNYAATLITAAGPKVVVSAGANPIVTGALYRFNYTTLTGTWNVRICRN